MNKTFYQRIKIFFCLMITTTTVFISSPSANYKNPLPNALKDDFWQYKNWTKVNKTPMKIDDIIAQLCAPAIPQYKSKEKNPHRDKFITVYVNDAGKGAMFSKIPKFPEGSVIVKEKLPNKTAKPELMTVMVKREKGFNPASGDWEYLVLDPVKTSILERGKLEKCQACHIEKKDTDFIFRTYYYR
jgi:hypothetical protein